MKKRAQKRLTSGTNAPAEGRGGDIERVPERIQSKKTENRGNVNGAVTGCRVGKERQFAEGRKTQPGSNRSEVREAVGMKDDICKEGKRGSVGRGVQARSTRLIQEKSIKRKREAVSRKENLRRKRGLSKRDRGNSGRQKSP